MSQPPAPTPRIVVVGGANTDVIGFAERVLQPRDSNPGHVRVSSGGVGRNIAENLARLGARVELVTAFGGDHNAAQTADECVAGGVAIGNSLTLADLPGSLYLAIVDESGDMALALSDMRPLERLTPDVLEERAGVFGSADLVVADANLPARSLEWLATRVSRTLVVDPVSVAKAPRVTPILARLAAVTPNALEAGILLGHEVRNRDQAESAAQELVDLGVQVAFVTCGSFGVAWADARSSGRIVAPELAHVVNATGAGDAFTAGISFGLARGWSAPDAARFASGLAAIALESERTVSDSVDLESVEARMPAPEDTSSIGGGEA